MLGRRKVEPKLQLPQEPQPRPAAAGPHPVLPPRAQPPGHAGPPHGMPPHVPPQGMPQGMPQQGVPGHAGPQAGPPHHHPGQGPQPRPEPRPEPRPPQRVVMHIGKSVHIQGELSGHEDMTIDGIVDGRVAVEDHLLTIGQHGRITADVRAKVIVVLGKVVGNITAEERAEVREGGSVEGDIVAPRVLLADGALFKGSIDMMSMQQPSPSPRPAHRVAPERAAPDRAAGQDGARRPAGWDKAGSDDQDGRDDLDDITPPFHDEDVAEVEGEGRPQGDRASKLSEMFDSFGTGR